MLRFFLCCKFNTSQIEFRTTRPGYLKTLDTPLIFLGTFIKPKFNPLEQGTTDYSGHQSGHLG